MDELIERIKSRVADPYRACDSSAWVRPLSRIADTASGADIDLAEKALGFPIPPLLRRLFTEVGNGQWGPHYGLYGIPVGGASPTEDDMVGFYLECVAPERQNEDPRIDWPEGLMILIPRGCVDNEYCDFLRPPYPVYLLSGDNWDPERPVEEALQLVASSLADRLQMWLDP